MASNFSLCGVCETLGHSSPSSVWCIQCDQGLCDDCEKRHKACSGTESHQMTSIDKYRHLPVDVLKISHTCPEHNERYQAYCDVHECACCFKCTLKEHRKCENLLPIDDVVKGVKLSNAFRECETNLEENKENIGIIIKDRQKNISRLSEERTRIQNEIKQTRKRVNEHLDNLETQLLKELSELEEEHTTKLRSLISSLDKKQQEIQEMQGNLSSLKEHASELQIFLSMKNMAKLSLSDDANLNKLCSGEAFNNISLSIELDKTLRDIEKNITTIGRLSQNLSPSSIVLQKSKDKQAQLHVPSVRSIDSIKLGLIRNINVNKEQLRGCCFLPDGRYAVTSDASKCIIVMTEDGTVDCQISNKPFRVIDITYIPSNNTVASTSGEYGGHCLNVIDLDTRKITRSIPSKTMNYGLTYRDGHLIFCAEMVGICKMNLVDSEVTTIKSISDMSQYTYISSYQDKLYYTDKKDHSVTCCSMDGMTKWQFKNEKVLCYPRGICQDNFGNVYVIGRDSKNVVVISPDGSRHSELLTKKDGLKYPTAIDYDKTMNRILLTNLDKNVLLLNANSF